MDKSEVDSVKVMIYLIEGVLPESYFANSLRGLSVDMAVFRDLLRIKLPVLSKHFDHLQCGDSKDCGMPTSFTFHPSVYSLLRNLKDFWSKKKFMIYLTFVVHKKNYVYTTYHLNQRKQYTVVEYNLKLLWW